MSARLLAILTELDAQVEGMVVRPDVWVRGPFESSVSNGKHVVKTQLGDTLITNISESQAHSLAKTLSNMDEISWVTKE